MSSKDKITMDIEGMTCANCALGIKKHLEKKGLADINVNFSTGEASFNNVVNLGLDDIRDSINKLGYKVSESSKDEHIGLSTIEKKFYLTLFFTVPLFLHMFFPHDFILNAPSVPGMPEATTN